jgi:dolichol-phosphate mannosyltransferase
VTPAELGLAGLLAAQAAAGARVLWRLLPGRTRLPPVEPRPVGRRDTTVTVVVATLNEAHRIGPCLAGLRAQGPPMLEALVVDSRSTDGTRELVEAACAADGRLRLVTDAPLPPGWVGKVWALETGLRHARGEWVLGLDADVEPQPGLVCAAISAARRHRLDVVSFAPRFADQSVGERWLQPAMLATLLYRVGAVGTDPTPERVMANGQCFLARRDVLERHGGYAPARGSFCDDVSLARHLARRGARVGFLDGSRLYRVRSYASAAETWREWGRSFDLSDAATPARQALDLATVTLAQGLPLPVLLAFAVAAGLGVPPGPAGAGLLALNAGLVVVRLLLQVAMRGSYDRRGLPWWGSVTADPAAVVRLWLSTLRRPTAWRGRRYEVATVRSAPHVS